MTHTTNDKGKSIYYKSRIYEGCERDYVEYNPKFFDWEWKIKQDEWYNYISTLPSHEVIGSHSFKDGQEVVLRRDYELQYQFRSYGTEEWYPINKEDYDTGIDMSRHRIIAIPLPERGLTINPVEDKGVEEVFALLKRFGETVLCTPKDFAMNPTDFINKFIELLPPKK